MNKREKETAAIYLSSCLYDMRNAAIYQDEKAKERAENDWKKYKAKIKEVLNMKFELFGLDYKKSVLDPMAEITKITMVFYSQRVNGQQLKYPA